MNDKHPADDCPHCEDGWTCEKHPGFPWPHPDENDQRGLCAGPGMPCLEGHGFPPGEIEAIRDGRLHADER